MDMTQHNVVGISIEDAGRTADGKSVMKLHIMTKKHLEHGCIYEEGIHCLTLFACNEDIKITEGGYIPTITMERKFEASKHSVKDLIERLKE